MNLFLVLVTIVGVLFGINEGFGFADAYLLIYGTACFAFAGISATFLWLYAQNHRELSMAMALSWAGAAIVNGAWYFNSLLNGLAFLEAAVLVGMAVYFTGAYSHLTRFRDILDLPRWTVSFGVGGSMAASTGLYGVFHGF